MEGDDENTRREEDESELRDKAKIMRLERRGDRREEERISEGRNIGE